MRRLAPLFAVFATGFAQAQEESPAAIAAWEATKLAIEQARADFEQKRRQERQEQQRQWAAQSPVDQALAMLEIQARNREALGLADAMFERQVAEDGDEASAQRLELAQDLKVRAEAALKRTEEVHRRHLREQVLLIGFEDLEAEIESTQVEITLAGFRGDQALVAVLEGRMARLEQLVEAAQAPAAEARE